MQKRVGNTENNVDITKKGYSVQLEPVTNLESSLQLLSEEGVKAINDIIKRESHRAPDTSASRGNKKIIRGLYYTSKFIRDLQNCRELRDFFKKICGEELVPHPSYSNSPQVKFGICYDFGMCTNFFISS